MQSTEMSKHEKSKWNKPSYQAYEILRFAFTVAPILAGLDKFLNILTNWEQYLSTVPKNV